MTLPLIAASNTAALESRLARAHANRDQVWRRAAQIVRDVRQGGDLELDHWTRKLEGVRLLFPGPANRAESSVKKTAEPARALLYNRAAMAAAWKAIPPELRRALEHAARNLRRMAQWQMPRAWQKTIEPGVRVGQIVRPLDAVGCYIPGGRHPLPSTVLMTAIPARVAGVKRVVAACPQPAPAVLAAGWLAGVDAMYAIGGAQAIAALAYGTAAIPKVDKIVGPGNQYVTAAKLQVARDCAIDFGAGPTEVLLVAEAGSNPEWLAADLLAQAEHDPRAAAWLLTSSPTLARAVIAAVERQLAELPQPNRQAAQQALADYGAVVVTKSAAEALRLANRIAPEHITLSAAAREQLRNAGSIFIGQYAPQAVGDYMSGANHVLPTVGGARTRAGLSVLDFVKIITVPQLTSSGLRGLAGDIACVARAEGLEAHARSVEIRQKGVPPRQRKGGRR